MIMKFWILILILILGIYFDIAISAPIHGSDSNCSGSYRLVNFCIEDGKAIPPPCFQCETENSNKTGKMILITSMKKHAPSNS